MSSPLVQIIAVFVATAVASLIIGWLMRASLARRDLAQLSADWRADRAELELQALRDSESLEDRLRLLGRENVEHAAVRRTLEARLQALTGPVEPQRRRVDVTDDLLDATLRLDTASAYPSQMRSTAGGQPHPPGADERHRDTLDSTADDTTLLDLAWMEQPPR